LATLPNLNKGVTKDPNPPGTDTQVSPIAIPDGTTLVTTKTTNETIDNVDQIIDYISGDNSPNFIPQEAIENLISNLADKENLANKGAISGYAGLDGSQELLLANFPAGFALDILRRNAANNALEFAPAVGAVEVFTWSAEHSMATFKLTAAASNDVVLNAPTGQSISIEINGVPMYSFNASQADFTGNSIINAVFITPTIASFINATHNHQTLAGGGLLDSTLALSDTANITYLNTANTWTSGLQNFSAVSLIIPTSAAPSVVTNGQIAYDSSVTDFTGGLIKFFGIAEQAIVSMPISQFTSPVDGFVVTYNATNDQFELQPGGAGTGDVSGPGASLDDAITRFDGETGKVIQNGVITIDDDANMQAIRSLQFTTFSSAPAGTTHIALVASDFHINTTTGNSIMMMVDDENEYDFTSTSANFNGNNLLLGAAYIQFTSISSPGVTGSATVGRLFLDNGNLNHTSIIRDGSIIDLEDTEVFTWSAVHSMATFKLTAAASNDVILNAPTGQSISIEINGTPSYSFNVSQADFIGNSIINAVFITPTISSFINATHNHSDAVGGGNLTNSALTIGVFSSITGIGVQTQTLDFGGFDLDNIQNTIYDLSASGTDVDFTEDMLQEISISADTVFTGTNYAIGKSKILKIITDATLRTLAFPAGWVFLGTKPVDQAASKTGILSLTSFTGVEAGVIAVYAVEG